jgi:hypothetical protein
MRRGGGLGFFSLGLPQVLLNQTASYRLKGISRGVPVGGRCELAASREVSWPRQSVSYKTPVLRIRDERGR